MTRMSRPSRTESPSMDDEEQLPQDGTPGATTDADKTPVERLEALGVRGILWQLARDGQIIDVRCEMPQCYCFRGRRRMERNTRCGRPCGFDVGVLEPQRAVLGGGQNTAPSR